MHLGGPADAAKGYGFDRMRPESRLAVGRLRNGGTEYAGPAVVDLAYLLGENGGHLNVNGIAGMGTKSSFLLHVLQLLMHWAKRTSRPGDTGRVRVVPVIFNVKNFDLFFIDRWNKRYLTKQDEHRGDWAGMGIPDPKPFDAPTFRAPQLRDQDVPVRTGSRHLKAEDAYSWSLSDIIEMGLFEWHFLSG